MNDRTPQDDMTESEKVMDNAFRLRRKQQLTNRSQPSFPASGESRVSARLAAARAEGRQLRPRGAEVIDLT